MRGYTALWASRDLREPLSTPHEHSFREYPEVNHREELARRSVGERRLRHTLREQQRSQHLSGVVLLQDSRDVLSVRAEYRAHRQRPIAQLEMRRPSDEAGLAALVGAQRRRLHARRPRCLQPHRTIIRRPPRQREVPHVGQGGACSHPPPPPRELCCRGAVEAVRRVALGCRGQELEKDAARDMGRLQDAQHQRRDREVVHQRYRHSDHCLDDADEEVGDAEEKVVDESRREEEDQEREEERPKEELIERVVTRIDPSAQHVALPPSEESPERTEHARLDAVPPSGDGVEDGDVEREEREQVGDQRDEEREPCDA
mmetsp:Transcript_61072/g.145435  ORF Transcript_61072/g.145435 Transcript_61072/m.145435 type:complete len:316 (-) Transcript_61072:292-1239(-)